MTSKISRTEYVLRAARTQFRSRLRLLFATLRQELDSRCYVSFSAGKDSSVLAHACHYIMPGIPILMVDPGSPVHWTASEKQTWLDYAEAQGWNLKLFPWDKYATAPRTGDLTTYRTKVHDDMFRDLNAYAQERGLTRRVMGLRRQESKNRRHVQWATPNTLCPLVDWTVDDVWCYIVKSGMPWLTIYDYLGPEARNGLIGRNGEAYGRLVYLRKYYPEAYRVAREVLGNQ
jgi:3'-phosphoadenosine 5'-phosphosulfate sulfotransferase (PAPS reductase)/FAD synthetase